MRTLRPIALSLLIMLAPASAFAADTLERARRWVEVELRYADAISELERALVDRELAEADRIEAYRLLATAYVAKNAPESAEAAFLELLKLAPDYQLDARISPKIRAAFEQARARAPAAEARLFDVRARPDGRRVIIEATIEDPATRLAEVTLHARAILGAFDVIPMERREDRVEAFIAAPDLERLRVDYYLEGADASGAIIARAGSSAAPLSVVVERPAAPTATSVAAAEPDPGIPWWVWVVGAVVVAGAATTAVVLTRGEPEGPTGTLDPIRLPLTRW